METYISTECGYIYYDAQKGLIYNLYVDVSYRRRGMGRFLIEAAKTRLRAGGFEGPICAQVKPFGKGPRLNWAQLTALYESCDVVLL